MWVARVVYLMFVISVLVDDLDGVLVCTMCSEVMGWSYGGGGTVTLITSIFSRRTSSSMPFSKALASLILVVPSSTLLDSKS